MTFFIDNFPWNDTVYTVDLLLKNYPEKPPKVMFRLPITHPMVSDKFEVDLSRISDFHFDKWDPENNYILDVLWYLRRLFTSEYISSLNEEDVLNIKSFRLYKDHRSDFNDCINKESKYAMSEFLHRQKWPLDDSEHVGSNHVVSMLRDAKENASEDELRDRLHKVVQKNVLEWAKRNGNKIELN